MTEPLALRVLEDRLPGALRASGVTGEGLSALGDAVLDAASRRTEDVLVEADPGNGRLLARLREWGDVSEVTFPDGRARVRVRLSPRHFEPVRREGGTILSAEDADAPEAAAPAVPRATRRRAGPARGGRAGAS